MKIVKLFALYFMLSIQAFSQNQNVSTSKPVNLLNNDLSYWYKWLGNPHVSVTGLPEGTEKGDGINGKPLGLKDPKNVFSVINLFGEKVLKVTGEIYGGLTTKAEYQNYHLHLAYKWGTKKWPPRDTLPRDMGIMFHLQGTNEDAFWSVFMNGMEFQISEATSGDLFLVPNKTFINQPSALARVDKNIKWNPTAAETNVGIGTNYWSLTRSENFESEFSKWTIMDLYTIGNSAIYLVNGHVVNAFRNASIKFKDGTVMQLVKGKIQLQSEGAEGYYKDITIQPINDFPEELKKAAGFSLEAQWKFGIALWSFHDVGLPAQLDRADSAGVNYVEGFAFGSAGPEFKDSMLLQLSPAGIQKVKKLIAQHDVKMESFYAVGGKTVAEWKRDFEIAKALDLKFVTAEPPVNMWDSVDSLASVYGIKVAIHNHWKGVSAYWSPDSVLAAIKGHPNFGACADLGHMPKSGIDPLDAVKKLEGHIFAIHFKDIAAYNDPKLVDVVAGKGIVNFPAIFKELKRQNFSGYIYIERDAQEKPNNLASVKEIVKYYNNQLGLPQKK